MAIDEVLAKIRAAERRYDRAPNAVSLIAVSKVQPIERIEAALLSGHRCFGENRVQEAQDKWPGFRERYSDISLHLLGPLQTNKIKPALELFETIESIDREKLATKISSEWTAQSRTKSFYVQVNTGEEPQKAGIPPQQADEFIMFCREECKLPVVGLMAIPPADEPPAPHFALLRTIAERNALPQLSMGMSADYEVAISMGATSVRVGSAVFGARTPAAPRS